MSSANKKGNTFFQILDKLLMWIKNGGSKDSFSFFLFLANCKEAICVDIFDIDIH